MPPSEGTKTVEQQFSGVSLLLVGVFAGFALGAAAMWLVSRIRINAARDQAVAEGQVEIARLTERASRSALLESKLSECASHLQEETNRTAALTEQSARVPELTENLRLATESEQQLQRQLSDLREKIGVAESSVESKQQQIARFEAELSELNAKRDQLLVEHGKLGTDLAETRTMLDAERSQTAEKIALLNDAREQMSVQFELLANNILEDKGKRFARESEAGLQELLGPLKTKLQEFQTKVEDVYVKEAMGRTALATQVSQLVELNQQLSQDAHNLTVALKGSSKTQGNWGEVILGRVLEMSGLREGHEYELRETYKREDGGRAQPDVVIHLPEDKHLVVDAKVSLVAYDEFVAADTEPAREAAVSRHLQSLRRHIKDLSEKNYQTLYSLKSLDFVVMFVPVEPAFMLALGRDAKLSEDAWNRNVLLVSPSTFLFVIRTVAYLWRQEQQNRNVQEIAKRGGEFYDKLVGFVESLTEIGERLRQATNSYDNAYNKLSKGRGNVIWQAETLRQLGVHPNKFIQQSLIDSALNEPLVIAGLTALADEESEPETESENAEPNAEEDIPF